MIVAMPVPILFAIRLVVALFVADQICQRKTIGRRNQIDAGADLTPASLESITRAEQPARQIGQKSRFT